MTTAEDTQAKLEANKALVRSYFETAFNRHQPDRANEFLAPDVRWHNGTIGTVEGRDNVTAVIGSFIAALPDLEATEQVVVAEGDYVFVWGVVEGTHRGDFFGVPPTGRKLHFDAPDLYRIADGKIVEEWAGDDGLAILAGLGVYTPPWMQGK